MKSPRLKRSGYAVCINNEGYAASLEIRKLYPVLADPEAEALGLIRVVDESGEDYLYSERLFRRVPLPAALQRALRIAS